MVRTIWDAILFLFILLFIGIRTVICTIWDVILLCYIILQDGLKKLFGLSRKKPNERS